MGIFNIFGPPKPGFRKQVLAALAELKTMLVAVQNRLNMVAQTEVREMALLDSLKDAVAANTAVDQSAIVLLAGLTAKIQELADKVANGTVDPAEVQALADELTARNAELAAAVTANTPAA